MQRRALQDIEEEAYYTTIGVHILSYKNYMNIFFLEKEVFVCKA